MVSIATDTVTATIPIHPVSLPGGDFELGTPQQVAVSPSDAMVYVTDSANDEVAMISTASNTQTGAVSVGSSPYGAAVTPDGTAAWILNTDDGTISLIDTATTTVTATISGFNGPLGIAFIPARWM